MQIDISKYIDTNRPILKISENMEFEVNNDKNTVLTLIGKYSDLGDSDFDIEIIDDITKLALGEKAYSQIDSLGLPFPAHKEIMFGIFACLLGEDFEVVRKRFQADADADKR